KINGKNDGLFYNLSMASPESDELPELETAALEELGADALSPLEPATPPPQPATPDPFGDLNSLTADAVSPPVEAKVEAPPPSKPAKPATVSAKELTDDILGGVDFDLPVQTAAAAATAPKPVAPVSTP